MTDTTNEVKVICSINRTCLNKTRNHIQGLNEQETWEDITISPKELVEEYYLKGLALNQSQFRGLRRCRDNARGGNLILVDLDDGFTYEQVIEAPTYKQFGIFVLPSPSSGIHFEEHKAELDGRDRWRVAFLCEREFVEDYWTDDLAELMRNNKRFQLERRAITDFINTKLCKDLRVQKFKDECGKKTSQLFYGNDGKTPNPLKAKDGSTVFYKCSTDTRRHINNGLIDSGTMASVIRGYKNTHPEILETVVSRSKEELEDDALIVEWIFNNDILNEEVLCDYDLFIKTGMAARAIDYDVLDSFLRTMERYADHYWRLPDEITRRWETYSEVSEITLGTIIHYANECMPDWRQQCPHTGGSSLPRLSQVFNLTFPQTNINDWDIYKEEL
jgi:hypothetical protein